MVFLAEEERKRQEEDKGSLANIPISQPQEAQRTITPGVSSKGSAPPGTSPTGASSSGFQDIQDYLRVNRQGGAEVGRVLQGDIGEKRNSRICYTGSGLRI